MFSEKNNQIIISNNIQQIIDTAFGKQAEKDKVIEMNLNHQFINSGLGRDKEIYTIPTGSLKLENFPNLEEIKCELWKTKTDDSNTPATLQIINCPKLRKMSLPNNLEHIYIDGKFIRECSESVENVNVVNYNIIQQKQDVSVTFSSIVQLQGRYYRKN